MWEKMFPFSLNDVREYKTATAFGCGELEHSDNQGCVRIEI